MGNRPGGQKSKYKENRFLKVRKKFKTNVTGEKNSGKKLGGPLIAE